MGVSATGRRPLRCPSSRCSAPCSSPGRPGEKGPPSLYAATRGQSGRLPSGARPGEVAARRTVPETPWALRILRAQGQQPAVVPFPIRGAPAVAQVALSAAASVARNTRLVQPALEMLPLAVCLCGPLRMPLLDFHQDHSRTGRFGNCDRCAGKLSVFHRFQLMAAVDNADAAFLRRSGATCELHHDPFGRAFETGNEHGHGTVFLASGKHHVLFSSPRTCVATRFSYFVVKLNAFMAK